MKDLEEQMKVSTPRTESAFHTIGAYGLSDYRSRISDKQKRFYS